MSACLFDATNAHAVDTDTRKKTFPAMSEILRKNK